MMASTILFTDIMGNLSLNRWLTSIVLAAIAILLLSITVQANDSRPTATVAFPKSGNTLELLFELSQTLPITTIRLAAIEAPDAQQTPWGPQARDCLRNLSDQLIRLEPVDTVPDAYGRLWAYGWHGKEFINEQLLSRGCAYLSSPTESDSLYYQNLLYAQESARILGLGIWDPAQPLRETAETFRQRSPTP